MTTMPNNTLVASSKLFKTKAPWRINGSLMGQITKDHDVILFDHDSSETTYKHMSKKIGRYLYHRVQREVQHLTFVGYEHECRLVSDLYITMGFKFDTAILINNLHSHSVYDTILGHTKIYNFWTKDVEPYGPINGAEENQYVKTLMPAHMSNRLASEISGCLIYGSYEQNCLENNKPVFNYVN
jgi:hypothetical protein